MPRLECRSADREKQSQRIPGSCLRTRHPCNIFHNRPVGIDRIFTGLSHSINQRPLSSLPSRITQILRFHPHTKGTSMRTVRSLTAGLVLAISVPFGFAQAGIGPIRHSVPSANQRVGTPATRIAAGFSLKTLAVGTDPLENPSAKIV